MQIIRKDPVSLKAIEMFEDMKKADSTITLSFEHLSEHEKAILYRAAKREIEETPTTN